MRVASPELNAAMNAATRRPASVSGRGEVARLLAAVAIVTSRHGSHLARMRPPRCHIFGERERDPRPKTMQPRQSGSRLAEIQGWRAAHARGRKASRLKRAAFGAENHSEYCARFRLLAGVNGWVSAREQSRRRLDRMS